MLTIEHLNLSVRAYNCMANAHLREVRHIAGMTSHELLRIKNLGVTTLREIQEQLYAHGYSLRDYAPPVLDPEWKPLDCGVDW